MTSVPELPASFNGGCEKRDEKCGVPLTLMRISGVTPTCDILVPHVRHYWSNGMQWASWEGQNPIFTNIRTGTHRSDIWPPAPRL